MHQSKQYLPWNFWINVGDISFYHLAGSFVFISTLLPVYLRHLTESLVLIGLIPATFYLFAQLPQVLFASHAEASEHIKPWITKWNLGERIPWLLLGISILIWPDAPSSVSYIIIFVTVLIAQATVGITSPAWKTMLTKIIHPDRKGLMFGIGGAVGGLMGAAGALIAKHILNVLPFPFSYGVCFLLGFGAHTISWLFLTLNKEPKKKTAVTRIPITKLLNQLPRILKSDNNFRIFLFSQVFIILGTLGVTFYIIYGKETFNLPDSFVASVTIFAFIGKFVGSPILGWIGDRFGHKTVIEITGVLSITSGLLVLFAPNESWLYAVFILITLCTSGGDIARVMFSMDVGIHHNRVATYPAITTAILSAPMLLAPIAGGWLTELFNFRIVFIIGIILTAVGVLIMHNKLQDPRVH